MKIKRLRVTIPFTGEAEFLKIAPSRSAIPSHGAEIGHKSLTIIIADDDNADREVKAFCVQVQGNLDTLRQEERVRQARQLRAGSVPGRGAPQGANRRRERAGQQAQLHGAPLRERPMSDDKPLDGVIEMPEAAKGAMIARGALNAFSGAIPLAGGFLSAIAGVWGEKEQERVNRFFEHWVKMLAEEVREKEKTIIEIMSRLR